MLDIFTLLWNVTKWNVSDLNQVILNWVFPRGQLLETCLWLILALCYIILDKHLVFNNNFNLLIITVILMIIMIMISCSLNRISGNVQECDPELSTENRTIWHHLFFFCTLHVYLAKKLTSYKIRGWKWTLRLQDYISHWTTDTYLSFLSNPKEWVKSNSGCFVEMCMSPSTISFLHMR